ncbi:MAG: peptidylprolyl isomerase [Bryobacteraceae bacterium]|jgi:parvulin-like peptidyl-prolyl isomerase
MKLPLFCSVLLPLALLAQNPAPSAKPVISAPVTPPPANVPPDAVVLVVGDMKFTREQFESLIQKGMAAQMSQTDRRRMAVGIANVITLAAEARRQALDQTPYAKLNLDLVAAQWLANQLVTKEVTDKPLDEAIMKAYYDKNQTQYDQITARHILIRTKSARGLPVRPGQKELTDAEALAKAQDIKKKLDAGADFAELAKTESDEPGADKSGGLLPVFTRGQMVPEFDKAAFAAEVGKVTDPVKTVFGYHLILVTDHKLKPYDQAKGDIEVKMKPQIERQYVDGVRMRTPVTIDEGYFGKPAAPPPTLGK